MGLLQKLRPYTFSAEIISSMLTQEPNSHSSSLCVISSHPSVCKTWGKNIQYNDMGPGFYGEIRRYNLSKVAIRASAEWCIPEASVGKMDPVACFT